MPVRSFKFFLSCAVAIAFLAKPSGLLQGGDPKNYFRKEIKLPELKEKQLVAISPDSELFFHASMGMGELRIVDEWGSPQPASDRMVNVPTLVNTKAVVRVEMTKWQYLPDGTTEVRFRLPPESAIPQGFKVRGFSIFTVRENFEAHAKVFGLGPMETRTLLGEGDLADYQGFLPLSKLDFPSEFSIYPEYLLVIGRREFKRQSDLVALSLDLGTPVLETSWRQQGGFHHLSVHLDLENPHTQPEAKFTFTAPRSMKVTQDPATAMTIVDLEASGEPIVAITPKFAEKDYFRSCVVYVDQSNGEGEPVWAEAGKENIRKINYKNLANDAPSIKLNGNVVKKIRLKIDNAYLPPLDLREVEFKIPEREFVFFAKPGQKLWVEYGDKTWPDRVGSAEEVQAVLNQGTIPVAATLGLEEAWESRAPVSYLDTLKQPQVLGGIGLGVLMVFAIYKQLSKMTLRKIV